MRTITQCAEYLREVDPATALTQTAIRRLVRSGAIPSIRVGAKYLIALEHLEEFCGGSYTPDAKAATGIRRVR